MVVTAPPSPPSPAASARRHGLARHLRRFAQHPNAVPLLAAILLVLIGSQIALVFKVPSWGNDEPAHVGYVASLAEGRLPSIESNIVDDPARFPGTAGEFGGWDEDHGDIWTANHPPLFHLAMVPVWWAASDHQTPMIITMRLANTLGFAVWLYLVGVLARELVPRRPAVSALAVVVAAAPTLVLRSAFFVNDGWAAASALVLFLVTVRMLRDSVTSPLLAVAVVAGVVAAGTRAQGVLAVVVCATALLIVVSRRDGWRRGVGVFAAVGGIPAAAVGWFYLRNLRLYGDLTGQDALLDKFDRSPVTGLDQVDDIPGLVEPTLATAIVLVAALVLVPVFLVRSVRRHGLRLDAAWALLAIHALVTLQNVVVFLATGGGFHDRYLMQVMPVLATATAVGMLEVGRWSRRHLDGPAADRRDWWTASGWSALLLLWLAGTLAWLEHHYVFSRQDGSPVDGFLPDTLVVLAVGVGAALLAVMTAQARASGHAVTSRDRGRQPGSGSDPVDAFAGAPGRQQHQDETCRQQ